MGFRRSLAFSRPRGGVHNRQGRPGQPIYREQPMSTANYRELPRTRSNLPSKRCKYQEKSYRLTTTFYVSVGRA